MTNNYMNNSENAMIEKKNFLLPEMAAGDFTNDDLADDLEGMQLSFQRVKIPGGGMLQFEIPGDNPEEPDYVKTIEGIIVYSHLNNAYWAEGMEYDDNATPLCSSLDGKVGCGSPGGTCATCSLNKFGTATDANGKPAKGKACKNMRSLYVLRNGDAMPILLSLPPTSLTPYKEFANACFLMKNRPLYTGLVQIGLKRVEGANAYSIATFKKLRDFVGEELMQVKAYALTFREQIKMLNQMRADDARNRAEAEPFFEDGLYSSSENGAHFEITSTDVLDGDKDELPM